MQKMKEKDEVIVIAGKDKGKRGRIKKILDAQRVIVEGVNLLKKHQKPNPQMGQAGGIIEKEAPMQISNIAIFNPSTKKADRVGIKLDGEVKSRVYKSTGAAIDS